MALSEQCRGYGWFLLSEPHVIALNSPSRTDATIDPDSEEEDMIDDYDGMVVDMEAFSCCAVSSLEVPQESDEADDSPLTPGSRIFASPGGVSWMDTSPN
jgi:hypothetical protein